MTGSVVTGTIDQDQRAAFDLPFFYVRRSAQVRGPLCRYQRTSSGYLGMSEKCTRRQFCVFPKVSAIVSGFFFQIIWAGEKI